MYFGQNLCPDGSMKCARFVVLSRVLAPWSLVLANLFPMFIVYLFDVCANGRHIAFIVIIIIGQDLDQDPGQCKQVMPHVVLPATAGSCPVHLGAKWQLSDWERNCWANLGRTLFSGAVPVPAMGQWKTNCNYANIN